MSKYEDIEGGNPVNGSVEFEFGSKTMHIEKSEKKCDSSTGVRVSRVPLSRVYKSSA